MKLYTAPDPDGFLFSLISSSMFLTWQKTVGGRLKSDPSFSITLVWNNFPLPDMSAPARAKIIQAGEAVVKARQLYPNRTLAQHYSANAMSSELLDAHAALDRLVDRAFGIGKANPGFRERQEVLFSCYAELASGLLAGGPKKKRARTT